MKKKGLVFAVILLGLLAIPVLARGSESAEDACETLYRDIPMEDMQEAMDEVFGDTGIRLQDAISDLIRNDKTVVDLMKEMLGGKPGNPLVYKKLLIRLIALALLCTLFGILPQILEDSAAAKAGYFISFITLITFLLSVFAEAAVLVKDTVLTAIFLMNAILPAYLIALALAGGVSTAALSMEAFSVLSYLAEHLILQFLCPASLLYLMLGLINQAAETDRFSRLADLIQKGVRLVLKSLLALFIGFHVFQGLITPYVDRFQTSIVRKSIEAIPGIGDIAGAGTEVVFGAAMVMKNSIGVVGLILITAAALIPILKIAGYAGVFLLVNALLQPVMQARVQRLFEIAANAIRLLLRILCTAIVLFLISIVMLSAGAGGGLQ